MLNINARSYYDRASAATARVSRPHDLTGTALTMRASTRPHLPTLLAACAVAFTFSLTAQSAKAHAEDATFEASTATAESGLKVDGATPAQLSRVEEAMSQSAYGPSSQSSDADGKSFRKLGEEHRSDDETKSCTSFYMPRSQMRFLKRMPATDPCLGQGSKLLAITDIQVLFVCKDGKSLADFDFSLGRAGVDKVREGDLKTPLGDYPLSKSYRHRKFGMFIPIGFPTPEQKKAGITGSEIGLHGPTRQFRCAGFLNTAVNWTQGCLAVASDDLIEQLSLLVKQNSLKEISIVPKLKAP